MASPVDVGALLAGVRAGDRAAVSRAITLVESANDDHRAAARELLGALEPSPGSTRVGISGVPGVGKSTFIETLGLHLIAQGHRVAVLTVDPSSTVSGGSILGDKTRMERLSMHERARPGEERLHPALSVIGHARRCHAANARDDGARRGRRI